MKRKIISGESRQDNVEFVISNQSFEIAYVDIEILVDDKKILSQEFGVEGQQPAQHNWHRVHISLSSGSHNLKVSTKKGKAQIETALTVNNTLTVTIAYWDNDKTGKKKGSGFFTVDSGEKTMATM